jgi:PhnB protein
LIRREDLIISLLLRRKNMPVNPIPENYHSVTPYLSIKGAAKALEFYKQAFNATEILRLAAPSGEIGHADIIIGNSHIMLADQCKESPIPSPPNIGWLISWLACLRGRC